jgi:sporulation protein YlmC with PRC-barrel domain
MGSLFPGEAPPAPSSTSVDGARVVNGAGDAEGPGPFVMSARTLAGDSVVSVEGDDLGKLEHIMIDVPAGTIAYGVLACGGVFGSHERLFAIPWSALTLDARRKCFVLDISKERLANTPGFDRDHWPRMADERWAREVHEHFGVAPYWRAEHPAQ